MTSSLDLYLPTLSILSPKMGIIMGSLETSNVTLKRILGVSNVTIVEEDLSPSREVN